MSQNLLLASATSARTGGTELLGYFRIGCRVVNREFGKKRKANSGGVLTPRTTRMTRMGKRHFLHEETEKTEQGFGKCGILTTEARRH